MNKRVSDKQIASRLNENDIGFARLELRNGISLLLCERGGRVFGPFVGRNGESLYWVNPAFLDQEASREMLSADWNVGGERWWVAPEIQYLCRDRYDYWNAEYIQPAMDPGHWTLEETRSGCFRLRQEMDLEVFNLGSGLKRLSMTVDTRPTPDPLRALKGYAQLVEDVAYAGYEQTVTLSEAEQDAIRSGAWNIIPLYPTGEVIIPASPHVQVTDYMAPIDADHQTITPAAVRLRITGQRGYLTGYRAAHVLGRVAYHSSLDGGRHVLIVRAFFSDPSAAYLDEPPDAPGWNGDSIRVYNDDGAYGGYGEMEVYGRAIGGDTGRSESTDTMTLWVYVGPPERLSTIAAHLLGVDWV